MGKEQIAQYEPQKLHELHRGILREKLTGATDKEIAEGLGVSTALVRYTKRSEVGQEFLGALEASEDERALDLKKRIEEAATDCLQFEMDVVQGRVTEANVTQKLKAAQDILDRGSFSRRTNVETSLGGALVTESALEAIKRRAREIGLIREVTEVAAEVIL